MFNIDVTGGHQRSNNGDIQYFFRKYARSSETIVSRRQWKKHSIALEIIFRLSSIRFELISTVKSLEVKEPFLAQEFLRICFELSMLAS